MVVSNSDPSAVRKRSLISVLVATGIAVAAASTACVANDGSIVVVGVLAPPILAGTTGGACLYTATLSGPFLPYGTVDVAFAEQYAPNILIGNQMVARGDPGQSRVETDNVTLQGAIVRITDAGGAQLTSYTVLGSGFVPAASGGTMSLGTFSTTLLDPATIDTVRQALGSTVGLSKRLISYMTVFGTTTGGQHIQSGEFGFPVNVCLGCLVSFPAGSNDPAQQPQPNCLGGSSSGGTVVTTPCVMGQDQPIDCRLCQTNPVCVP